MSEERDGDVPIDPKADLESYMHDQGFQEYTAGEALLILLKSGHVTFFDFDQEVVGEVSIEPQDSREQVLAKIRTKINDIQATMDEVGREDDAVGSLLYKKNELEEALEKLEAIL